MRNDNHERREAHWRIDRSAAYLNKSVRTLEWFHLYSVLWESLSKRAKVFALKHKSGTMWKILPLDLEEFFTDEFGLVLTQVMILRVVSDCLITFDPSIAYQAQVRLRLLMLIGLHEDLIIYSF